MANFLCGARIQNINSAKDNYHHENFRGKHPRQQEDRDLAYVSLRSGSGGQQESACCGQDRGRQEGKGPYRRRSACASRTIWKRASRWKANCASSSSATSRALRTSARIVATATRAAYRHADSAPAPIRAPSVATSVRRRAAESEKLISSNLLKTKITMGKKTVKTQEGDAGGQEDQRQLKRTRPRRRRRLRAKQSKYRKARSM